MSSVKPGPGRGRAAGRSAGPDRDAFPAGFAPKVTSFSSRIGLLAERWAQGLPAIDDAPDRLAPSRPKQMQKRAKASMEPPHTPKKPGLSMSEEELTDLFIDCRLAAKGLSRPDFGIGDEEEAPPAKKPPAKKKERPARSRLSSWPAEASEGSSR